MNDAVSVQIAKQVTTYLDSIPFVLEIFPERSYADWELELKDSDTLHVDVVAVTTDQKFEMASRGMSRFEIPVDIAIRKRFGTADQHEDTGRIDLDKIDELVLLTQQIYESMTQQRLPDELCSVWRETKILVAPDVEALRTKRQFTGVVRVTFEAHKPICD